MSDNLNCLYANNRAEKKISSSGRITIKEVTVFD